MRQHKDWFVYTSVMNALLANHPVKNKKGLIDSYRIPLDFDINDFGLCLTGLKKSVYYNEYGVEAEAYIAFYLGLGLESLLSRHGFKGNCFLVFQDDSKQLAILFSKKEGTQLSCLDMARIITLHIQNAYEKAFFKGDTRFANVSSLTEGLRSLEDVPDAFRLARQLNDLSFFRMQCDVITEALAESWLCKESCLHTADQGHALKSAMEQGDSETALAIADNLFLGRLKHCFSIPLCMDTLSYIKHQLILFSGVYRLSLPEDWEMLCEATHYATIEDCYAPIRQLIEDVTRQIASQGSFSNLVLLCLYYVHAHFDDPGINLPDIAGFAGTNANYLSSVFRREVGLGVRQYITKKRMERAKELLMGTDLKISDIADQVGIENPNYFSRLFKDQYGVLPKDCRETNR